ncbi:PepSY-like domain-containing protein [Candidatus Neomarinimicrobiota bacterium]
MKRLNLFLLFGVLSALLLATGCDKLGLGPKAGTSKSMGSLVLKASIPASLGKQMNGFPVSGGTIDITMARVNIADLVIEENSGDESEADDGEVDEDDNQDDVQSGFDGEFEGEDGDDDEDHEDDDEDDVLLPGPYALDISDGVAEIATVEVGTGTYRKVDFSFSPLVDLPFDGYSILIDGTFTPDGGAGMPFSLKSTYSDEVQCQIADSGITVDANMTVPVVVIFDVGSWLGDVDFSLATIVDNAIAINPSANQNLLTAFEANLAETVEVGEQDEDDEEDDEEIVEIPDHILAAILGSYPDAIVDEAELDSLDGEAVYQIDIVSSGSEVELTFLPDGTLVQLEEEISSDALPAAVLTTLTSEYPDGTIEDAKRITRGDVVEYEVEVVSGTIEYEILLDAAGNVLTVDQDEDIEEENEEENDDGDDD